MSVVYSQAYDAQWHPTQDEWTFYMCVISLPFPWSALYILTDEGVFRNTVADKVASRSSRDLQSPERSTIRHVHLREMLPSWWC